MAYHPPRGTRDFLPAEMAQRQELFGKIRQIFRSYGYGEVWTPAFEEFALLAKKAGKEIEQEIYTFEDKGGRKLGLRFDPTVPICRIVAGRPELPKPIKFCYITNMWRYDKPQAGRWREFWQAGVELIGSPEPLADVEMLAVVSDILRVAGVKQFTFRINSRTIIEQVAEEAGIPEQKRAEAFRAVDKLSKIGMAGVAAEMARYGIPKDQQECVLGAIQENRISGKKADALKEIVRWCRKLGIRNVEIDLSIVRGIDYYTGFVFETLVKGSEGLGSVASGGRYDTLIGLYGKEDLPATGFGLGIDRLIEILRAEQHYPSAQLAVVPVSDAVREQAAEIAQALRAKGMSTYIDLMGRDLRKQLDYVNSTGMPFALFVGEKELKEKKYTLRDMKTGRQTAVTIEELVTALQTRSQR